LIDSNYGLNSQRDADNPAIHVSNPNAEYPRAHSGIAYERRVLFTADQGEAHNGTGGVAAGGVGAPVVFRIFLRRFAPMATGTVRLHRVLRAPAERVYRAYLDADALCKWLPPHGFTGKVHHLEAKVGGSYKMSFINFSSGRTHSFGGEYLELVPNERIFHTDRFDDPGLPGEMRTTISLKPVSCGTELNVVQEGNPAVIPTEACYLGWQESLTLLAQLVEAEIPD
jgi:uncharacterized protein YndB with AHSA1/START domain